MNNLIIPNWPAPATIHAYTTTRQGGVSIKPYDSFNMGDHVGDDINHVKNNRAQLSRLIQLPSEPIWLQQTHSTIALTADANNLHKEADATFTKELNQVCAVLTADCLPILICNEEGSFAAAIHAGWRGLAHGIIENTLKHASNASPLLAWLGPAIGPSIFEVGPEVRDIFLQHDSAAAAAFQPSTNKERWLANLFMLAEQRLRKLSVSAIYGGNHCTHTDHTRFYSYRRDGKNTGRMATLIWISNSRRQN